MGGALCLGRLRFAPKLGIQAIPASRGYSVDGAEIIGTGIVRIAAGLSAGLAL